MLGKMEPASRCVWGGGSFKCFTSEMNHQPLSSVLLTREVCVAVCLNCAVLGEWKWWAPKGTEQLVSEMGFLLLKKEGLARSAGVGLLPQALLGVSKRNPAEGRWK